MNRFGQNIMASELSNVGRNMDALIQELAQQCQRVFHHASGAASRVSRISFDESSFARGIRDKDEPAKEVAFPFARERTLVDEVIPQSVVTRRQGVFRTLIDFIFICLN